MALTPQFANPHGQGSQTIFPQALNASADMYHTLDAAGSVIVTGQTGRKVVVEQVIWSYSGAPTGGAITISDGTITLSWDVSAAGFGECTFSRPLAFTAGASVTVTLADPGGAVVSKLIVVAYVNQ